jgi:hypothetical protein
VKTWTPTSPVAPLLVHACLFGASYREEARSAARAALVIHAYRELIVTASPYRDIRASMASSTTPRLVVDGPACLGGEDIVRNMTKQPGCASMIVGYAGSSDRLDIALTRFAGCTPTRPRQIMLALVKAADRGIVPVECGL